MVRSLHTHFLQKATCESHSCTSSWGETGHLTVHSVMLTIIQSVTTNYKLYFKENCKRKQNEKYKNWTTIAFFKKESWLVWSKTNHVKAIWRFLLADQCSSFATIYNWYNDVIDTLQKYNTKAFQTVPSTYLLLFWRHYLFYGWRGTQFPLFWTGNECAAKAKLGTVKQCNIISK